MGLLQLVELRRHGLLKNLVCQLTQQVGVVMVDFVATFFNEFAQVGSFGSIHNG